MADAGVTPRKRVFEKRNRANAPLVMVTCDCGCKWVGWATVDNRVIDDHRRREQFGRPGGCKVDGPFELNDDDLRAFGMGPYHPSRRGK